MTQFSDHDAPIFLIAEDHQETRNLYRSTLKKVGSIIECKSGKEALQKIAEELPDIVISDVDMPGLDGFELCRTLKSNELTNHIPVILLTGSKTTVSQRIEGIELGADDYLLKPCDPLELRARALNLIEQRKRLLEKFSQVVRLSWEQTSEQHARSADEQFLQRILALFIKHMHDETFQVEDLAEKAGYSRSQLHRKFKAITGKSASQFLQELRLNRAKDLLKSGRFNVSEVSFQVGYSNLSYFSKVFKETFGMLPSDITTK
ncbi:MAG: response regulator [Chloroherpetonaceae bacterium]|nr:response regulator [Chloroherpetonaceae bacterium]